MFFRNGAMLFFQGAAMYSDHWRYNEIARGLSADRLGEFAARGFYRKDGPPGEVLLSYSLWRVADRNIAFPGRCERETELTIQKSNGERISYVIVPQMSTDDICPCEYTEDKTFADIADPRTFVAAREYTGPAANIAINYIREATKPFWTSYYFGNRNFRCEWSDPYLWWDMTGAALDALLRIQPPMPETSGRYRNYYIK